MKVMVLYFPCNSFILQVDRLIMNANLSLFTVNVDA